METRIFGKPILNISINCSSSEVGGLRLDRGLIVIDCKNALEAAAEPRIDETQAHAAGTAEEIDKFEHFSFVSHCLLGSENQQPCASTVRDFGSHIPKS